ncbi:response regulator transcription factor [Zhengella sp. ZM62]|uniref:response regulator transcription factor n=1 Tax=Zhengella sedimenti TaxID=3390035 RepID=UPI0039763556
MPTGSDGNDAGERCRILVADDDAETRATLVSVLSAAGHEPAEAASPAELFGRLGETRFDLVTLDLVLGGEDGLALARRLRSEDNIPVIIITERSDPLERVRGLESGADDYITKPFHPREVEIRVRTVLERYGLLPHQKADNGQELSFDHTVFNGVRRLVRTTDAREIHLTETEFNLLAMFLENPGRILSRDEIWQKLRGRERDPLDRTLDGHVAHLREKIENDSDRDMLIKSVRGVGYVFVGDVRPAFRMEPGEPEADPAIQEPGRPDD